MTSKRSDILLVALIMLFAVAAEVLSVRYFKAEATAAGIIMGAAAGLGFFWAGSLIYRRVQ